MDTYVLSLIWNEGSFFASTILNRASIQPKRSPNYHPHPIHLHLNITNDSHKRAKSRFRIPPQLFLTHFKEADTCINQPAVDKFLIDISIGVLFSYASRIAVSYLEKYVIPYGKYANTSRKIIVWHAMCMCERLRYDHGVDQTWSDVRIKIMSPICYL